MRLRLFQKEDNHYQLNGFDVYKVDDHFQLPINTLDRSRLVKFIKVATKLNLNYLRVNNEYYRITIG